MKMLQVMENNVMMIDGILFQALVERLISIENRKKQVDKQQPVKDPKSIQNFNVWGLK